MTIGNMIYHLPYHIKNLMRQVERLYKLKNINNNYSQVFNKTCVYKYVYLEGNLGVMQFLLFVYIYKHALIRCILCNS